MQDSPWRAAHPRPPKSLPDRWAKALGKGRRPGAGRNHLHDAGHLDPSGARGDANVAGRPGSAQSAFRSEQRGLGCSSGRRAGS